MPRSVSRSLHEPVAVCVVIHSRHGVKRAQSRQAHFPEVMAVALVMRVSQMAHLRGNRHRARLTEQP